MSPPRVAGPRLAFSAALSLALAACGAPAPSDRPERTGSSGPVPEALPESSGPSGPAPKIPPEATCADARDDLGDLTWIPRDARVSAVLDLRAPKLDDAARQLARAVADAPGLPIVAALGLGQLDLQLDILRGQLRTADLAPHELLLLHEPGGAVIWVLRARCDLGVLQAALARAWGLRSRNTASGPVAEAGLGARSPYDVVFLADDRLALVPAGHAGRLRRWLEAPPDPSLTPGRRAEGPGELLASLSPAPIRVVLAGRGLLAGDAAASPRTLQAWPDRVAVSPAN